jgi:hypothetical protein
VSLPAIVCRYCKQTDSGCPICGGFKVVFEWVSCMTCEGPYLIRPGVHTVYEGKKFTSVDGVTVTVHLNRNWECDRCPTPPK